MWGVSPKFFFSPVCGGQQGLWELAVVFKMAGRKKRRRKKQKRVEFNPTRGRNQHSISQGFIQGLSPSLDWKKISLLFSLCELFMGVYDMCLHVGVYNWCRKVCLLIRLPLSRAAKERWHFSFLISSFIPFLFFPPSISPRLPSSHPDQRTHRPLLGTPCPGNPPCTVKYPQCLQSPWQTETPPDSCL